MCYGILFYLMSMFWFGSHNNSNTFPSRRIVWFCLYDKESDWAQNKLHFPTSPKKNNKRRRDSLFRIISANIFRPREWFTFSSNFQQQTMKNYLTIHSFLVFFFQDTSPVCQVRWIPHCSWVIYIGDRQLTRLFTAFKRVKDWTSITCLRDESTYHLYQLLKF